MEFVRHDIAIQVLVERMGVAEVEELFAIDIAVAVDLGQELADHHVPHIGVTG